MDIIIAGRLNDQQRHDLAVKPVGFSFRVQSATGLLL
jgi:hypothetical protein